MVEWILDQSGRASWGKGADVLTLRDVEKYGRPWGEFSGSDTSMLGPRVSMCSSWSMTRAVGCGVAKAFGNKMPS